MTWNFKEYKDEKNHWRNKYFKYCSENYENIIAKYSDDEKYVMKQYLEHKKQLKITRELAYDCNINLSKN